MLIGIDMGGTNIRAARVSPDGVIDDLVQRPLPPDRERRRRLPAEMAVSLADGASSIGLAVAGIVTDGRLAEGVNIGLADVDFRAELERLTGLPTTIMNDAQAAAVAESRIGLGESAGMTLMVTVGTGIGGALVHDGRLIVGRGFAGEIGHSLFERGGPVCGCGSRGCWELFASGTALAKRAADVLGVSGDGNGVAALVAAAERGDASARGAITECADAFGTGLNGVCAILAPSTVILGGGVMARGGLVARLYEEAASSGRWLQGARIERALLGDTAGVVGAALTAQSVLEESRRG